ncbi:hypothetical protein [Bosea vaviloviae]|uniref:hypothetical protein n=1 Tax=Bosea vaviloviae TaxID=1526658 RepID=UPI0011DF748D|nr:hypothetical protein [Bosea vaviloviae]
METSIPRAFASANLIKRLGGGLTILFLGVMAYWALPPNTLNPFCTYRAQYRLEATLQVDDELINATAVRQLSQSRRWVSVINSGGCGSGVEAMGFKSKDNRVFLIDTYVCGKAEDLFFDKKDYTVINNVDIIKNCSNNWPNKSIGFIVDNSDNPTTWQPFNFLASDSRVKLISMSAESTWRHPLSNIHVISPNLLKTEFAVGQDWWNSPARLLGRPTPVRFRARKISPTYLRS